MSPDDARIEAETEAIDRELRADGYGVVLTRVEVAEVLGVSPYTVYRYEREGRLRRCSRRGHPRYRRASVALFLSLG